MSIAALITWIITAGVGSFMLIRWVTRGGIRKAEGAGTHFPPARVFTHFGLAAVGLILWIVYLVTDNTLLAWIAFADLVLIALLGGLLVRIWAKDGRAAMAGTPADIDLAEQHIPRPPVVLHGVFAISTVVLVFFAALGVGPGS
jgi:manganese efflux pump family protein